MSRPEADAYRYIAKSLGARFAGDMVTQAEETVSGAPQTGSTLDVAPADPRAAALLDRVPVAILVVTRNSLAFMNKTAVTLFGYSSCNVLEAAGGLGALFHGGIAGEEGMMVMTTAAGATFHAKVTMAASDWARGRAMLITVLPLQRGEAEKAGAAKAAARRDPLASLLDANPDPVALVTVAGTVSVSNSAFRAINGDEARLDERLSAADRSLVLNLIEMSFCLSDGCAESPHAIRLDGKAYHVSAGALLDGGLACLVFHPVLADLAPSAAAEPTPRKPGSPLEQAVREVRRLVTDAAILLVSEDDTPLSEAPPDAEAHLLRLVLLSMAARAPSGSIVTARRHEASIVISASAEGLLEVVLQSERVRTLAQTARLNLSLAENGTLTITPLRASGILSFLDHWR
ncbi:PAS domain-containing protein [Acuticoccus kandeliae]|uniref:PAS domain-containing protein n=1 Tax=Acuticoccus kandeliae TaxID=2073160 RepID=UPI00130094D1|nr:PAS domain-containing protein [Acuticoccus kandeliae]